MPGHKTEKFWDKISKKYEATPIKKPELYNKTLDAAKKYFKPSDRVLEIGCGTGTIAVKFADSAKEILATDISSKMLEFGRKKAKEAGKENVTFMQADIFDERLQKGSYDVIYAFSVLHLLENLQKVMPRINALLKPGGLFISTTVCLTEKNMFWPVAVFFLRLIGLAPYVKCLKIAELEDLITKGNLQIIEKQVFYPKPPTPFIVARKGEGQNSTGYTPGCD